MWSKQHLHYKYKCFNGCQAVSDVDQNWNTGQNSGCCCWKNFWAKTDPGEELNCSLYESKTPLTGIHSSYRRIQHCPAGVSFQAHQSCSGSCTLPSISLLSQAQTSFFSDCVLHNWLVGVCVLRRPGPISAVNVSSQRAGEVWTPQATKKEKYLSILLVCFFSPLLLRCFEWFDFTGPRVIIELNQCETSASLKVVGEAYD